MKQKLLIIGVLPPPIGGVSIHVKRLLENLHSRNKDFGFVDLKKVSAKQLFGEIIKYKIIHFNLSNAYIRLLLILITFLLNKKVIFTQHNTIGSRGRLRYYADLLSVKIAHQPLMLNDYSLKIAKKLNKNSLLISAFIPPVNEENLSAELITKLKDISSLYSKVWATNAFQVKYDKNNEEIYQILLLVKIFKEIDDQALVISDPSGTYATLFVNMQISLPANIMIIPYPHSFSKVLEVCNGMLRITTTDGDSLSVKEALLLNKMVIATNVVERPQGVILTDLNKDAIKEKILNSNFLPSQQPLINSADQLIVIYDKFFEMN